MSDNNPASGRDALLAEARDLGIEVPEGCSDAAIAAGIAEERAAARWQSHLDGLPDSESRVQASLQLADQIYGGTHSWGDRTPYDPALIAPPSEEEIVREQQNATLREELERQLANVEQAAQQAAATLGVLRRNREDSGAAEIAILINDAQRNAKEASSLIARWRW